MKYIIIILCFLSFKLLAHDGVNIEFVTSHNCQRLGFEVNVKNNKNDSSNYIIEVVSDLKKKSPSVVLMIRGKSFSEFDPQTTTSNNKQSFSFKYNKKNISELQILIDYQNIDPLYLIELIDFMKNENKKNNWGGL